MSTAAMSSSPSWVLPASIFSWASFTFSWWDAKSLTAPHPKKRRRLMVDIWYAILTFMLLMFLVLEGFDIGAGMLQFLVGKTEAERRLVIAAIGPLWSWHE